MPSSTINIEFAKSSRPPVPLAYKEVRIPGTQARFRGRYALAPEISLQSFRRQAVIDWLGVRIRLATPSQGQHVKAMVASAIGRNCWAKLLHENEAEEASRTGRTFAVRLQEPRIADVLRLQSALLAVRDLSSPVVLIGMEVSVDFYPRTPSADARSQLFAVVHRHHWPVRNVLAVEKERPRFNWERGDPKKTAHILPKPKSDGSPQLLTKSTRTNRTPFGDSTFYAGARYGPVLWRIMDKEIDQQNIDADTFIDLMEKERRVRIEVSLGRDELNGLGLATPEDLASFRFERLQSRYFAFKLPTFRRTNAGQSAPAWLERERRDMFIASGVIALKAMDDADRQLKNERRHQVIRHLKNAGRKPRPLRRTGTGSALTFVAYEEMNKAVETALRHLREREEAEMRRVGVR